MEQSILKSTKKILGVDPADDSFDLDIITHINAAFFTLDQLGVGPISAFLIEDEEPVWGDYLEDDVILGQVKTYVFLKVRMLFDPPNTSYLLDAMNKQIEQAEWRLNVARERVGWVPGEIVLDGGDPEGG